MEAGGKTGLVEDVDIVGVDNWAGSAVMIRLRFKVVPIEQWTMWREFLRRLKQAFDMRGIEIPFPHLAIRAGQNKDGSAPPLRLISHAV